VLGYVGTVGVTQAANAAAATGKLGYAGALAQTQASQTATAAGLVANPITGTLSVTQAQDTATAVGLISGVEFKAGSTATVTSVRVGATAVTARRGSAAAVAATAMSEPTIN
jgi:hypothetical protein